MELGESRVVGAPPEVVWAALTDPEVLRRCIPGCQEMVGTPEDGFDAVVVQKVGPVKATFRGRVTLQDVRPGESCRIVGEGKGGAAGFARGAADVTLTEEEGSTRLAYVVDAGVGGKLAQLGSRVIEGVARRMAEQFFSAFQSEVEGGGPARAAQAD